MRTAGQLRFKAQARRLLLVLLVAAAGAGVLWYQRLEDDAGEPPPAGAPASGSTADMVTRDFRHVETRLDRTVWVLEAAEAAVSGDQATLRAVKVTWHGETGRLPVVITSDSGAVDFRRRTAVLRGAVRVVRSDGATLLTEELAWDEKRKHLRAPREVVITAPNFTFRGDRLDASLESEHFVLRGRVSGDIRGGAVARPRPS